MSTDNPVRCLVCRDLFAPEQGRIPVHYLDTHEGQPRCDGSGME